jgi:hypothetical protein
MELSEEAGGSRPRFALTGRRKVMAFAVAVLASALAMSQADWPSLAEPAPTPSLNGGPNLCRVLDRVAVENGLPMPFFTRLIWQESRFNPRAQSWAGAQGIAQFMPGTAASRGLLDPFEPATALRESAAYLRELRNTFGNLGLAAAAYNAGPYRVTQWLGHDAALPEETVAYVQIVTGRSVWDWASPDATKLENAPAQQEANCDDVASLLTLPPAASAELPNAPWKPWGVQIAGAWTQGPVLAAFERIRRRFPEIIADREPLVLRVRPAFAPALHYVVRLGEDSAAAANRLCDRLRAAGGACDVTRNPH